MNRRGFLRGFASLPFVGVAATLAAGATPALATGGIVKSGGRYLVGEHGSETIVPDNWSLFLAQECRRRQQYLDRIPKSIHTKFIVTRRGEDNAERPPT